MALFEIFADDEIIFHSQSPAEEVKLINPRLILEDNAAGSFTCAVPPSNRGYDLIERLTSTITVYRDKKEIWSGRIIEENQDFFGNRKLTCEGELAYLNDTTQPPAEYHSQTVRGFLETLISKHNDKCTNGHTFRVGVVTVTDPNDSLYRYTNFESTLECIADKLVDRLGGHIRVRKENGVRYIDYLDSSMNTNSQTIEFGKNMIDFSKSWDLTDFVTVIVPQGERLEESPIEALDAYLDVSSVNGGSIYVYNQDVVDNYGWIESVVRWDNVANASNLLSKAKKYLSEIQFENMVLELSAVDLHYMNINIESIELLDKIHCISRPHGMDKFFPVTKIEIPIDNPDASVFTLGDNEIKTSLSGEIKKGNSKIQDQIDSMPSTTSFLNEAKANADQIMRQLSNGYITTVISDEGGPHSEKLIISDTKNYLEASRYWEWSVNGLAYYKDKTNLGLALTMDGSIVADRITTGTMSADRIRTGYITDEKNYNYWNLNTGEFRLAAVSGSTIGGKTIASQDYAVSQANSAESNANTYSRTLLNTYDGNLNQLAIFNKLTNNGKIKGLYLSNGELYINANYIATGVLTSQNNQTYFDLSSGALSMYQKGLSSTDNNKIVIKANTIKNYGIYNGLEYDVGGITFTSEGRGQYGSIRLESTGRGTSYMYVSDQTIGLYADGGGSIAINRNIRLNCDEFSINNYYGVSTTFYVDGYDLTFTNGLLTDIR